MLKEPLAGRRDGVGCNPHTVLQETVALGAQCTPDSITGMVPLHGNIKNSETPLSVPGTRPFFHGVASTQSVNPAGFCESPIL